MDLFNFSIIVNLWVYNSIQITQIIHNFHKNLQSLKKVLSLGKFECISLELVNWKYIFNFN